MKSLRRVVIRISVALAVGAGVVFLGFEGYRTSSNEASIACAEVPASAHQIAWTSVRRGGWSHLRLVCVGWNRAGHEVATWRPARP